MSETLENPDLPPGAIVEVYDDGGARRNDGIKLTPVAQNPWYILATVEGEQDGTSFFDIDWELHEKNRRIWNGWMCQNMSEEDRADLAEKMGWDPKDLDPLTKDERARLLARFAAAFPGPDDETHVPEPGDSIDLRGTYALSTLVLRAYVFAGTAIFKTAHFAGPAYFKTAHFAGPAIFHTAHFAGSTIFETAHFAGDAFFQTAHFAGLAIFETAHFSGYANFETAHFAGLAIFQTAHFAGSTIFETAHFAGDAFFQTAHFARSTNFETTHFAGYASFETAHFAGYANFHTAHFAGYADFSNGVFQAATVFTDAKFQTRVPQFYQRDMHQDTRFTAHSLNWPKVTVENADAGKQAYTRLRQIASQNHNPDDEHFFLRQEMRCKEQLATPFDKLFFRLYRWISDSGISVARPALGLVFIWAFGMACYSGHFDSDALNALSVDVQDSRYWTAAGLSFGNLFGFLGINRLYFLDLLRKLPDLLQFIAGFQTVAGVVLLFFLGLGLRNRFRLK